MPKEVPFDFKELQPDIPQALAIGEQRKEGRGEVTLVGQAACPVRMGETPIL